MLALSSRAHSLSLLGSDVTCQQASILGKYGADEAGFQSRRLPLKTQTLSKIMTSIPLMTDRASPPHLLHRNLANCYYGIRVWTCICVKSQWVFLALLYLHKAVSSRYTSCFQCAQRGHVDPWGPHTHVELAGADTHPGPETTGQAGSEGRAPCLWPELLCHCLSPWIVAQHNIRTCHCSYTSPKPSQ